MLLISPYACVVFGEQCLSFYMWLKSNRHIRRICCHFSPADPWAILLNTVTFNNGCNTFVAEEFKVP